MPETTLPTQEHLDAVKEIAVLRVVLSAIREAHAAVRFDTPEDTATQAKVVALADRVLGRSLAADALSAVARRSDGAITTSAPDRDIMRGAGFVGGGTDLAAEATERWGWGGWVRCGCTIADTGSACAHSKDFHGRDGALVPIPAHMNPVFPAWQQPNLSREDNGK